MRAVSRHTLHDAPCECSIIVRPHSVEPSKNTNNSAVLHAINTGLALIDCTQKCAFYMQNLASWKQGKVVKKKTHTLWTAYLSRFSHSSTSTCLHIHLLLGKLHVTQTYWNCDHTSVSHRGDGPINCQPTWTFDCNMHFHMTVGFWRHAPNKFRTLHTANSTQEYLIRAQLSVDEL